VICVAVRTVPLSPTVPVTSTAMPSFSGFSPLPSTLTVPSSSMSLAPLSS
jgi:hypothetical protein